MSKELEIIGFNGSVVGRIGLTIPIAVESRSGLDWRICFKVGGGLRDEISDVLFNNYEEEGRVTRLPKTEVIECPEGTFVEEFQIVVGFAKEQLLRDINQTRSVIGSDSSFDFYWEDSGTEESILTNSYFMPERRVLRLLSNTPRTWYWIGDYATEKEMLNTWSDAFL